MELATNCRLWDTCCRRCPMLDGAAASVVAATQSIVVVKVVVMKVLVLGALAPIGEELL
jgi:hypothetical protein